MSPSILGMEPSLCRAGVLSHSSHRPIFTPCLSCFKQKCSPVLKWMSCVAGLFKLSWARTESGKFLFYALGLTAVLWQDELNSKIFFGSSVHITIFYCNGLTGFWYVLLFLRPEKLVFNSSLCGLVYKTGCFDKIQAQGVMLASDFWEKERLKQKYIWLCGAVTVQSVLVLLVLHICTRRVTGGCCRRWGLFLWGRVGTRSCLKEVWGRGGGS